jgi:hypothetical protein
MSIVVCFSSNAMTGSGLTPDLIDFAQVLTGALE